MDYFTSDTHFGHANIIRYCNRPFRDVEHMREEMIRRWNEIVRPEDRVFVLGDFALGRNEDKQPVFDRLMGEKLLVVGNHDNGHTRRLGWGITDHITIYEDEDAGNVVVLVHDPSHVKKTPASRLVLHGHLHGMGDLHPFTKLPGVRYIDVGADCWDYTPITMAQIKNYIETGQRPGPRVTHKQPEGEESGTERTSE